MKFVKLLIPLILFVQLLAAQKTIINEYAAIDKKALQLPDSSAKTTAGIAGYISSNFANNTDKIRAIFIWTATNIQYDIDNMYAINFYETPEDKINKTLSTHKGVCENYAVVFNDICLKAGIKSFFVGGYTSQNINIPHAWCAAFIDTAWFMFDPTWGSGYIENKTFYKKTDNRYFKVSPSAFIKTHMPFDFLWQFLYYPVTNQEFYDGKTEQNTAKPFFNFKDSIVAYEHQNRIEQLMAEARRTEKNGVKNSMIFDRLQHIKMEIESDKIQTENKRQSKIASLFNTAAADYNQALNYLNVFINYRNHQFTPEKPDADIQRMIDTVNAKLTEAKTNLKQITHPDADAEKMINQLAKAIIDLDVHVKEQQDWLNVYFTKPKAKRKSMFYEKKTTFFGLPVN